MEQVILLTRKRLLKKGEIREAARDMVERNRDYFDLVTGECAFIAADAFSWWWQADRPGGGGGVQIALTPRRDCPHDSRHTY